MTVSSTGTPATGFACRQLIRQAIDRLDAVPYWLLALPLRAAVAPIFWRSGMTKIADWDATLYLFSEEYRLPLLPPELAAYLATTVELVTPPLLILGLLTRPVAAVLLGMTLVIQFAVYPNAWPVHIQWVAMLLILLCRGAGSLSLDHLLLRRMKGKSS